jgi:SPP1 gp7 family putative phage head morphogenesis protein
VAWSAPTDTVDFEAAIAWFRKRVALKKPEWVALRKRTGEHAFTVANVAQLDVVNHVWKAIDSAVAKGTSFDEFKKTVGDSLRAAWGGTVDNPPWRIETIFRTNVQNAYSAGRYRQATHPDVLEQRPVWMFDAILDGRETAVCAACDGTKRPAADSWWQSHNPPLHHNCRSSLITLTETQAGKLTKAPSASADEGFGAAPSDVAWEPDLSKYPGPLAAAYRKKTA